MQNHTLAELLQALADTETNEQKTTYSLEIAKFLIEERDYPQAQRYASQTLPIALPAQVGEAYYQLARTLFMQGEAAEAQNALKQAIASFETKQQPKEVGKCYNLLGALFTNMQDFGVALQNFETAIEHNEASQNAEQLGKVFAHLSIFVRLAMPIKNVQAFYQNLLVDAPLMRKAYIEHNLGVFYRQENQAEKALNAFQKALAYKQDDNMTYELGETSYQLASLHDLKGAHEISFQFHLAALGQLLEEEKPAHVEMILYYLSHALTEDLDNDLRTHTLELINQASKKGFEIPKEATKTTIADDDLPTPHEDDAVVEGDLNFASRLAEVAEIERNLSVEELAKYYATQQDVEIGVIWLKKLLGQYNNAWFGRKAKLKIYEDAKNQVLQDIATKLTNTELDTEERDMLESIKNEIG